MKYNMYISRNMKNNVPTFGKQMQDLQELYLFKCLTIAYVTYNIGIRMKCNGSALIKN